MINNETIINKGVHTPMNVLVYSPPDGSLAWVMIHVSLHKTVNIFQL